MLLKDISYYKTGGSVDRLYAPASLEELALVMKEIHHEKIPLYVLGAGSNSLVMDDHWTGAVITFNNMRALKRVGNKIIAQAGVENSSLSRVCLHSCMSGAGWMYSLPGQVGATVRMNARCYGGEISQIVESVTAVSRKGDIKTYFGQDVFIGYKDTVFNRNDEIVVEVTFSLERGEQTSISNEMDFCKTDRENKQQFLYPSCGCVFKNDHSVAVPSSLLLDRAGAGELSTGQVEISPHHANFIYNKGAGARDILTTALDMRDLAYERFEIWLEFEMEVLGVVPEDLKARLNATKSPNMNNKELKQLQREFLSAVRN